MNARPLEDKLASLSLMIAILALILCSLELAPGRGLFQPPWPPAAFYSIMGIASALAGALAWPGYPLPGVVAGPIAGIGALATVAWHLAQVNQTADVLVLFMGAVGALPGITIFFALKCIQDLFVPPRLEPDPELIEDDSPGYRVEEEEE